MLAKEMRRGLLHACRIERARHPGGTLRIERGSSRAVEDQIAVDARLGAVAGVKVRRHGPRPKDRDVLGQIRVSAENPTAPAALGMGVEVRDLSARVYAGIGAPGGHEAQRLRGDAAERLFQDLLNGAEGLLALPAGEG